MRDRIVDPPRLQERLRDRQWTRRMFMEKTGYSKSTVYALLAGRRDLTDARAWHVATVLGCTIEDFTAPRPAGMARGRTE